MFIRTLRWNFEKIKQIKFYKKHRKKLFLFEINLKGTL